MSCATSSAESAGVRDCPSLLLLQQVWNQHFERIDGLVRWRDGPQPKTQLQAQAIAAAINLVRIRQMLQRTQLGLSPRLKRPLSPFARLRPLLAA